MDNNNTHKAALTIHRFLNFLTMTALIYLKSACRAASRHVKHLLGEFGMVQNMVTLCDEMFGVPPLGGLLRKRPPKGGTPNGANPK